MKPLKASVFRDDFTLTLAFYNDKIVSLLFIYKKDESSYGSRKQNH